LNKKNFLPEIGKTVSVGVGRRRPHLTEIRRLAPATIFLDYLKCGRRLLLRSRRPGDRFQPLGQKKPKKLKEFLIDRKIRQSEKNSYPLLSKKSGEIIAVIGLEIGERYKISGETKKILKIH
jgi:tRNA(Ile)-lysidine synthase